MTAMWKTHSHSRKQFPELSVVDGFLNRRSPFKSGWGHHLQLDSYWPYVRPGGCSICTHLHRSSRKCTPDPWGKHGEVDSSRKRRRGHSFGLIKSLAQNFSTSKPQHDLGPEGEPRMARINIEDSLYRDKRFIDLYIKLQSVEAALGALVRVWTVAQRFYTMDDRCIPREEWDKQGLMNQVIEVGLASEIDGRIRVAGADEQFGWLVQRIEAGRRGGLSKGKQNQDLPEEVRLQRHGARVRLSKAVQAGQVVKPAACEDCGATNVIIEGHHSDYSKPLEVEWLCKKCHTETHRILRESNASANEAIANRPLAEANRPLAEANRPLAEANPSSLTLTPSLPLSPNSVSDSSNLASGEAPVAPQKKPKRKVSEAEAELRRMTWEAYSNEYHSRWAQYPVVNVKTRSQVKSLVERVGQEAPALARFYVNHNDSFFVKDCHPIGLLLMKCEGLLTQMRRDQPITTADVRQFEKTQQQISMIDQLKKVDL